MIHSFGPLRHLHLWNVAAFETNGDKPGSTSSGNPSTGGYVPRTTQGTARSGQSSSDAMLKAMQADSNDNSARRAASEAAARANDGRLPPAPTVARSNLSQDALARAAAEQRNTIAGSARGPVANRPSIVRSVNQVESDQKARNNAAAIRRKAAIKQEQDRDSGGAINNAYQDMMNRLTPFDNQEYIGGKLYPTGGDDLVAADAVLGTRGLTAQQRQNLEDQGISTGGSIYSGFDIGNLQDQGVSYDDFTGSLEKLRTGLDEPRFGPLSGMPTLQGIDYLLDMNKRRAYEQLTGTYEPSGIASALGIANKATSRYVPVMDGGQIVGSLSVDANGKPLTYTGQRTANAKIMDPTIDQEAAKAKIASSQAAPMGPIDDGNKSQVAQGPMGGGGGGNVGILNPCPTGYVMDPKTQSCVPDPFQVPFAPAPTTGVPPTTTAAATTPYSPVSSYTQPLGGQMMPTLNPGPQTAFTVPTPNTQPITLAQQGLGSLPFRTS